MFLLITIALALLQVSAGKIFSPCELALELKRLNVSESDTGNLVCMAREGNGAEIDTRRMVVSSSHNVEMGLFQISTAYWCLDSRNFYNECNVDCEKLVDDEIRDDLECAQFIIRRHNFDAFFSWTRNCKGQDVMQDISECGL